MLTIQPKVLNNYRPAFKASEENNEKPISLAELDEDTYEKMHDELENQRDELEDLAENEDFKLPKPVNKLIKGGAIVTTGLLGGMASGWGTKKSIAGLSKLGKTSAMQGVKKHIIDFKVGTVKASKSLKTKFLKSKFVAVIKNGWQKFGEKKGGKPIVKFFNSVGSGIKAVYNKVSKGVKHIWNKIRGVKKETWEKATVNTVGVSGGIASGVTALKEKSGEKD